MLHVVFLIHGAVINGLAPRPDGHDTFPVLMVVPLISVARAGPSAAGQKFILITLILARTLFAQTLLTETGPIRGGFVVAKITFANIGRVLTFGVGDANYLIRSDRRDFRSLRLIVPDVGTALGFLLARNFSEAGKPDLGDAGG